MTKKKRIFKDSVTALIATDFNLKADLMKAFGGISEQSVRYRLLHDHPTLYHPDILDIIKSYTDCTDVSELFQEVEVTA